MSARWPRRHVAVLWQSGRRAPSGANWLRNAVLVPSLPTTRCRVRVGISDHHPQHCSRRDSISWRWGDLSQATSVRCLWSPTICVRTSVFAGVDGLQCWEPSEVGSVVASWFRPGQRCSNLSWSERTREPVWQPLRRSDADGWVATDEDDRTPNDRCFQHVLTWSAPRPE